MHTTAELRFARDRIREALGQGMMYLIPGERWLRRWDEGFEETPAQFREAFHEMEFPLSWQNLTAIPLERNGRLSRRAMEEVIRWHRWGWHI